MAGPALPQGEGAGVGLHGIRHLSASILVNAKVSLLDVQAILRHTNLTTTQRYVHRLESVRKAIEVFE